jgi:cytochrome c553
MAASLSEPPPGFAKCQGCHGKDGNSTLPDVPRLNGQDARYLARRIRSFADPTRQSFHAIHSMWGVNSGLSDAAVAALSDYFSRQLPTPSAPAGTLAEQGRKLYAEGDGFKMPSCQGCHGRNGEGGGAVPRLAGQHSQYLRLQLQSFSLRTRVSETMNPHTRTLDESQIVALLAFLAKN